MQTRGGVRDDGLLGIGFAQDAYVGNAETVRSDLNALFGKRYDPPLLAAMEKVRRKSNLEFAVVSFTHVSLHEHAF